MSGARWYDLFGRRVTRRDFLQIGRDVAACIALGSLPAAGSPRRLRFQANPFTCGVASGDPASDGVVLWTRLSPELVARAGAAAASVEWEVAEDEAFSRIVQRGTSAAPVELGHAVHVEAAGLRPGRPYWYRFFAGNEASAVGRTRTAPADEAAPASFRLAFASCQNYEHGYYTAYRHAAAEDLDLLVHLGDYIYERRYASAPAVRPIELPEAMTLDQYRARYAVYRSDPDLQAAHAACAWVVTPDDHEVTNNYADATLETGARPEDFLLRRAAGYQAFYEFMPLRRSSLPAGPDMQLFRGVRFGTLLDFHVLDSRQYRSAQVCGGRRSPRCGDAFDPSRTMLGPRQEAWLEQRLLRPAARWNLLANQVMIAQLVQRDRNLDVVGMDRWDGYVAPRRRLLELFARAQGANPVVLTGDIHTSYAAELRPDFDDRTAPVVATELVGTSIASGGDGSEVPGAGWFPDHNPHVKFCSARRGYVRVAVTPERLTADFRTVPFVSRPGAPVETRASFVVEASRPGLQSS